GMAPGVAALHQQPMRHTAPQLDLQSVVMRMAGVYLEESTAAHKRIHLEQVCGAPSGSEPSQASSVRRDGIRQRACLTLCDLRRGGGVVVRGESGCNQRQRLLSRQTGVLVRCRCRGTRESEIRLSDLEFVQEPVFKNVYL